MKVDASIRSAHSDLTLQAERLQEEIDELLKRLKHPLWHYESRIKSLESFALKIESGLFDGKMIIDDFFAATIVVRTSKELSQAASLLVSRFTLLERRPESDTDTNRLPNDFSFNDLRLYLVIGTPEGRKPRDIDSFKFEVQIKTFIQHAWGIATHDFSYKSSNINWARQRVAYEVRALLEHAELSIDQMEALCLSPMIAKTSDKYTKLIDILTLLKRHFSKEALPTDLIRLSQNVGAVLSRIGLTVEDLDIALLEEAKVGRGVHLQNLSPYGIVLQSVFNVHAAKVSAMKVRPFDRLVVSAQVEVPTVIAKVVASAFQLVE